MKNPPNKTSIPTTHTTQMSRREFVSLGLATSLFSGSLIDLYLKKKSTPDYYQPYPWLSQTPLQITNWNEGNGLQDDPNNIIKLPADYTYHILEQTGSIMNDGHSMPTLPDGMACFPHPSNTNQWVLMRNHEVHGGSPAEHSELAYSLNRGGGVSRVVINSKSGQRISSNMVLTGTSRNCSGGVTPWGWISCEEIEEPEHGYAFLCSPSASKLEKPNRLTSLGRFVREAIAYDNETGITYMTEDTPDAVIYRHVPTSRNAPFAKGQLQAMKIVNHDGLNLSEHHQIGDRFDIEWINIPDAQANTIATRHQAHELGAAIFVNGEGTAIQGSSVYFTSTKGGPEQKGQLYRLDIDRKGIADKLVLVTQAENDEYWYSPDNMTITPQGELFLVEDTTSIANRILALKPDGQLGTFAESCTDSEFTGICLSPDNRWMFVNLQKDGLTLAITRKT
jgi:secreted PhoX family phosphatase